jgi:hypothetical protein
MKAHLLVTQTSHSQKHALSDDRTKNKEHFLDNVGLSTKKQGKGGKHFPARPKIIAIKTNEGYY